MTAAILNNVSANDRSTLTKYTSTYPVRLGELARELGVSGIKISSMKTGISGQIAREDGNYIIRVNRNESRERQRFTIAHELSHYLLHRHIIDSHPDGITDNVLYRSGAPEGIEYEANRLAAEIVMPAGLMRNILKNEFRNIVTEATIENLAERFQVSKVAMEIRLTSISNM